MGPGRAQRDRCAYAEAITVVQHSTSYEATKGASQCDFWEDAVPSDRRRDRSIVTNTCHSVFSLVAASMLNVCDFARPGVLLHTLAMLFAPQYQSGQRPSLLSTCKASC